MGVIVCLATGVVGGPEPPEPPVDGPFVVGVVFCLTTLPCCVVVGLGEVPEFVVGFS